MRSRQPLETHLDRWISLMGRRERISTRRSSGEASHSALVRALQAPSPVHADGPSSSPSPPASSSPATVRARRRTVRLGVEPRRSARPDVGDGSGRRRVAYLPPSSKEERCESWAIRLGGTAAGPVEEREEREDEKSPRLDLKSGLEMTI
jgi:hypothetical protein